MINMDDNLIQKFGYTEMYEWAEIPAREYMTGRFVTFDKEHPEKIRFISAEDDKIVGITTVCALTESDNPDEWSRKSLCNEYGDLYLRKEKLAVGEKVYDQLAEMNYIQTRPWEHFITIPNQHYDSSRKYVKRTNRSEWVRVNLMGKVIVSDNGECQPGGYCKPCISKVKAIQGIAIPAEKTDVNSYYVLERLTDHTILILNK